MYIKFKIIVYRAKIQKKCAEYKKLAVSFNKIRYAQECTKKKLRIFLCHSIRFSIFQ
ncbi:unknown [Prevotella sp. CAG:1092]|nr:unknown [Prevotella sp. CAG:1092]